MAIYLLMPSVELRNSGKGASCFLTLFLNTCCEETPPNTHEQTKDLNNLSERLMLLLGI